MSSELSELRSQVDRLSRDSRTDPLTGVGNRRSFDEALTQLTREAKSNNTPLCLIMADIDFFKVFNDTHGHPLGDKVLRSVAIEIEQCVKGRDRLARYGGEEFAILLPATPLPGAILLAESIRAIIEVLRVRDFDGNEVEPVTLSLGVSQLRPEEDSLQFLNRADDCLYLSKQNGRNCVSDESQLTPH
ncbi:MAG: GGDEF domain-containing protein [Pseudomonadota bacterium]